MTDKSLYSAHPRESGDPVLSFCRLRGKYLDPRFRGDERTRNGLPL